MKQVIVIPARYESTRLPGKPLVNILGKSLVQRVWERCIIAVDHKLVFVATDDDRISEHCKSFGAQVVMTPKSCLTGTDRLFEANKVLKADSIINVQGDEPLVDPADIRHIARLHFDNPKIILNGMGPLHSDAEYRSATVPKVVVDNRGKLLYMSRAAIPSNKKFEFRGGYKQICIYGFSAEHLKEFGACKQKTNLEELEDIEILRFLELGHHVQMLKLNSPAIAVDVPDDLLRVEQALRDAGES